ncbi:MAG: transporter substrate-binding domain-containing protein [Chloroflexota bacterium]
MGNSRRAIALTSAALMALTLVAAPVAAQDGEELDQLGRIQDRGLIVMSTDPLYAPQSFLDDEGDIVGFDIDVGTEIASRLGVDFVATPVAWAVVSSGRWADRFDFSVGSMTITVPRIENIDFTQPYYFNPAWISARSDLGATSPADLAGQTICVGEATTYFEWMNGTLDMGELTDQFIPEGSVPPEGSTVVTRTTDRECANEWGAGRQDFQGWITSAATTEAAIEEGLPVTPLGDPVFYEPLAVAFDNSVEDNDSLVAAVDQALVDMHEDGTLTELSMKWFGEDLTKTSAE